MPTIKQSQKVDRTRLEPLPPQQAAPMLPPSPPSDQTPSPFMVCSLPPIAASLDQVTRQFYNRTNVPSQRILQP